VDYVGAARRLDPATPLGWTTLQRLDADDIRAEGERREAMIKRRLVGSVVAGVVILGASAALATNNYSVSAFAGHAVPASADTAFVYTCGFVQNISSTGQTWCVPITATNAGNDYVSITMQVLGTGLCWTSSAEPSWGGTGQVAWQTGPLVLQASTWTQIGYTTFNQYIPNDVSSLFACCSLAPNSWLAPILYND
jgi:hypothetical protein